MTSDHDIIVTIGLSRALHCQAVLNANDAATFDDVTAVGAFEACVMVT